MPETTVRAPGTFCWVEVGTTNREGAKSFYRTLFGWKADDSPAGDGSFYTMLRQGDNEIGGLYELSPEMRSHGVPPHWMSYVLVTSADETAAKVKSLGGNVAAEPFDVMDIGRMAVFGDPTGATFAVWQPKKHSGSTAMGGHGTPCWYELCTRDTAKAGAFYHGLFGWNLVPREMGEMTYTMLMLGDASVGGMMEMTPEFGDAPPHWMVYFEVKNIDESVATAQKAGATVVVPKMPVVGVGELSLITDPQGAHLSIIELKA